MSKSEYTQDFPIVCCLCDNKIHNVHQRHNCAPVVDSWCCSSCNEKVVVPYRMKAMYNFSTISRTHYPRTYSTYNNNGDV